MTARIGRVERVTSESTITVEINLDGTGKTDISTGVPFYDHMLTALGKHGAFDLTVHAQGDVDVDGHHTVEDTAICLGQALRQALGDKAGIRRFGEACIPPWTRALPASWSMSLAVPTAYTGVSRQLCATP